MGTLFLHGFSLSWLTAIAVVLAQKPSNQKTGIDMECVGNVMRLTLDKSLASGSELQVDAMNGSQVVPLTPDLAAKCGYSMQSDHWGNTRIYTSLLSCFTQNQDDCVFNIGLRLRMYGNQRSDVHEVTQTCEYNEWASREILCERNFMEVSVYRLPPEIEQSGYEFKGNNVANSKVSTSLNNVWRMVFYTPKEKPMMMTDVQNAGYCISSTPSRLVLRSPYNMADTYTQNVNGVPMEIFRVTTYFKREWSVTMIDTAAACPTGGLHFTDEQIIWILPRYITPLMMEQYEIIELYMGINGKRLDKALMNTMGYTLSVTDSQIILTLPVGGTDGYYKSHALDYKYHTTYSIEPMLELLWKEGQSITRYKVQYPITTPLEPRPPQVMDNTVVESGVFDVQLGSFLHDVDLMNITFSTGVMTVAEANARGFNVQQHRLSNGAKTFSMHVPFSDPVVLKANANAETTTYTLPLIFGLIILPEYTPFPQPALVEVSLKDITLPTIHGTCDEEHFYITISYGNQGKNFKVVLGDDVSTDLFKEYSGKENSTHMSMALPFLAQDVVFESVRPTSIRGRLDVQLIDAVNNWHLKNFSLACSFPMTMTECFSNGSMTALAVKVEAASQMVPSQLTLKDPSCKPTFSNDRFAYFSFDASSCGTTRLFSDGFMIYENEISVGGKSGAHQGAGKGLMTRTTTTDYRVMVSCYYMLNDTQTVMFVTKPQQNEPFAEMGVGELQVKMRLAKDDSYTAFYMEEDYPVEQYLRQPLYFEVELTQSTDPRIEVVLENCWATVNDGVSTLRWDLIVNGCENLDDRYKTIFHHVAVDNRVQYPAHLKRFEVKMFAFVRDNVVLRDQAFVHCEAVICDVHQTDGVCKRQCPLPLARDTKRVRRSMAEVPLCRRTVSSGKILLSSLFHF